MKINFRYTTDYDNKDLLGDVDMEINISDAGYNDVEEMFHRFMSTIGYSKPPVRENWDDLFVEDALPQERDLFDD